MHSPDASPVDVGPTTSAPGSCRLLSERTVAGDVGMRLARVTVQRAGGKQVGCTFYALQHPTSECGPSCLAGEHLPGPHQPAVQLLLTRYASTTAAHNAMVRTAEAGRGAQQVGVGGGRIGLAYQIAFYRKDHGRDWACAFNVGSTLAEVRTVTTRTSFNAVAVAKHLAAILG
ncbi:MAG TPA: hypothetical protein VFE40_12795 [Jatrophihabitantaceae bacterium]|nr:hypothetical protein [Jatrophihabitantaceae bacterium]